MKTNQIFKQTSVFIFKKILVGLISMLIVVLPAGILFGIGCAFSTSISIILLVVGFLIGSKLQNLFYKYFGYMVKAGHVAVIAETIEKGQVPENQYEYGKQLVKDNFVEANVYFDLDLLVSKAVKQIQKKISGLSEAVGKIIPFADTFINQFIQASLDYVDECCLGYTFYKKDKNKFRSSSEGIVLYFQNWKGFLKTALKSSFVAIGSTALVGLIVFAIFGLIFRLIIPDGTVAFVIALIIAAVVAGTIKSAVVDTYVMINQMNSYLPYAMNEEPKIDLYSKFSKVSKSFRELFEKGQADNNGEKVDDDKITIE